MTEITDALTKRLIALGEDQGLAPRQAAIMITGWPMFTADRGVGRYGEGRYGGWEGGSGRFGWMDAEVVRLLDAGVEAHFKGDEPYPEDPGRPWTAAQWAQHAADDRIVAAAKRRYLQEHPDGPIPTRASITSPPENPGPGEKLATPVVVLAWINEKGHEPPLAAYRIEGEHLVEATEEEMCAAIGVIPPSETATKIRSPVRIAESHHSQDPF